jgi:hypothetical protein
LWTCGDDGFLHYAHYLYVIYPGEDFGEDVRAYGTIVEMGKGWG